MPPMSSIFLKKLYDMIQKTPEDIGGWCNNGTAFQILKENEFAKKMLPQYFKHNKYQSFVRQLNFYGFDKHRRKDNSILFSHGYFQFNKPYLMGKIKRKTNHSSSEIDDQSYDAIHALRNDVVDIKTTISTLERELQNLRDIMDTKFKRNEPLNDFKPNTIERISFLEELDYYFVES